MDSNKLGSHRPRRKPGRYITTRSGKVLKINRSLGEKWALMKNAKTLRKAGRLRGLPKSRLKRFLWRLNPRRQVQYWFSRDGAIMALKITGIAILVFFVLTLGVFAYFRKDLPKLGADISGDNLGGSISYYDRTGNVLLWQDYNAIKRVPVQSKEISPYIKDATVAVEDRDFYKHRGFDLKGIARAAVNDLLHHGRTQGGSTITQQLVKLTQDWTQQRTFSRKVKELILAVDLERTYSKDEILTGYLNAAPYGGVDYGVQVAASDYFHKGAKDLTLAESAMLAAIPKSPSLYSPYNHDYFDKNSFLDRYNYVLDSMVQTGRITKTQAADAKKVDVLAEVQPQQTKYAGIQAPYFVLAAKNEITTKYASKGPGSAKIGGWKVITTLDMNLQKLAEQTIQNNRRNALSHGADEQALVAEDVKSGQMVALVGGVDFNAEGHGQINYAQWNIAPGSSFKPYDYVSLIDSANNAGAGSVLYDVQQPLPQYPCTDKDRPPPYGQGNCLQDYDYRYPGPETLRYALGGSRNIPAVKAMLSVVPGKTEASVNKVIGTADGLMNNSTDYACYQPGTDVSNPKASDKQQCYGASAIGDGSFLHLDQHVNGLASISRMGLSIPSTYLLKIIDSANQPLYQWKQPKVGDAGVKQVVRPEAAYIVNNMASDPNASYLPAGYYKWHRYNGWTTAVKTGTTNNGFDGLMMAWNTQYAVGSWVGYHTRNQALSGAMEYSTTPLTRGFMTAALDALHTQPVTWTEPSGLQHSAAYVVRNHIGIGSVEPSPATDIFPSWYKPRSAGSQATSTIDKVSTKLATNCTPALAKETVGGNSNADQFSVDVFYGAGAGSNANTNSSDDVHSCGDSKPTVTLTAPSTCSGSCTITATASQGTHPLNDPQYAQFPGTINFFVNGQLYKTVTFSDTAVTTQSITYTVTGTANITVSAQVIDSVLYDANSDTLTVSQASAQGGSQNQTFTITRTKNKVEWEVVNGASYYKVYWSTSPGSPGQTNKTNFTVSALATNVYVEAYDSSDAKLATSNTIP